MNNQPLTVATISAVIKKFFQEVEGIYCINLFGSFAKGTQTSQSDIDIAILFAPKQIPSKLDLLYWKQELSDLLHREIDIICLNDASPILGMQVEQTNIPIVMTNETAYANYVIYLYSSYAELKELRAPMEKQILSRRIYDK